MTTPHLLVRIERGAAQAMCGLVVWATDATVNWTLRVADTRCAWCRAAVGKWGWSDQRTLGATE